MIAAVNSFTDPWGGPEFGSRVFFTTDVAFLGCRNDQAGNSSRQFVSPAGRGNCFLQSPSERQLPLGKPHLSTAGVIFRGLEGLSLVFSGIWLVCGDSGVSQPVERCFGCVSRAWAWNECKEVVCGGGRD